MGWVLASGVLGFSAAVVGFLLFGLSPVAALVIWACSGPAAAVLVLLAAALRRPDRGTAAARRRELDFLHTA
jgi:hypothetical protein